MQQETRKRKNLQAELLFCLFLLGLVFLFFIAALGYRPVTRYAPMVVLVPLIFMLLLQLGTTLKDLRGNKGEPAMSWGLSKKDKAGFKKGAQLLLWMGLMVAFILFFGQLLGIALFLVLFLKYASNEPWWLSLALGLCVTLGLHILFERVLKIMLYAGALFKYLGGLVGT